MTVGKRYRLGPGSIRVDRIRELNFDALTPALARRSGFASLVDLLKVAKHGAGERVFLVEFHYIDEPPHPAPRASTAPGTVAAVRAKLAAMDGRSPCPWTRATLRAIARRPGVPAAALAAELDRARDEFKRDVRKLKALGLTISLEVGYRLSKLGETVVRTGQKTARS